MLRKCNFSKILRTQIKHAKNLAIMHSRGRNRKKVFLIITKRAWVQFDVCRGEEGKST